VRALIGKLVVGSKGVVSDHHIASQVGMEILRKGGNAFDAAIAISAVLSVVQPHMGGPGGDGFLMGFIGDDVVAYMSSGRSPGGFNVDEFLEKNPVRGPLTVTVPGLVALWGAIYDEYASMSIETLLEPAIKLAYNGFNVGLSLHEASRLSEQELSNYKWVKYFKGLSLGQMYRNIEMSKTLRLIATRGFEEFYYGELAENVVKELQDQGVNIGLDDFMEHEVYKVKPLELEVDNMTLYELPPNTQGVSTLQAISALYELGLDRLEYSSSQRPSMWSEPTKNIYLFRDLYLGDPDYMEIDAQSYVKYSEATKLIHKARKYEEKMGQDTTFFIVYDGESIVGFIQSLFYSFGSGLVACGFPVQNRAIGFAKSKGLPNSPAPKKLPLHTLSILGVDAGDEKYIIGCVGGDLRPQLHLRVYENIFVYKMRLDKAVAAPRFIYTTPYDKQVLTVEEPLDVDVQGLNIIVKRVPYGELKGHVHVAQVKKNVGFVACDPRSEGVPLAG
jgi:gamma-glutamyltranspeptidase/glutathione hydrolase